MAILIFIATILPVTAAVLFMAHNNRVTKAVKAGEMPEGKGWGPPVDRLHFVLRVLLVVGLLAAMVLCSTRRTLQFYPAQASVLAVLAFLGCLSLFVMRLRYGRWN